MGGLGGHMAHLSEDLDLTFSEILDVLGKVARAEIKKVTEKVDGQNLFLSIDSAGGFRAARNKSDIKRGGMTLDEYVAKWKGHPAENAFMNGFSAITTALKNLDAQRLQELFSGGERYINMEIMYPKNPNIIRYTSPEIVLHGLVYVGKQEDKKEQKRLEDLADAAFKELSELVDAAESQVGEELWRVHSPKIVELQALADGVALEKVTAEIERFAEPVGVNKTLGDLAGEYLRQYAQEAGLPNDVIDDMLILVLNPDEAKKKGITSSTLKKRIPKELKPVISKLGTKTGSKKVIASILKPLEKAISDFAIEVLRGMKSFFVDAHDEEVIRMRQELEQSIAYLQRLADSGDPKAAELIDKQLSKLGDIENVASSLEGIVFEHPPGSGKIYKLTGAFAMANQLIGRARRSGMNEGLAKSLTINVSKDTKITKTLREWLDEMKGTGHVPGNVPFFVYEDILSGGLVVESVRQEDAQEVVYNTVYEYTKNFLQESVDIEIEDEPNNTSAGTTYALVPGSMKPPTLGHAGMIETYAAMDDVDEVLVFVSQPNLYKIDKKTGKRKLNPSIRSFPGRPEGISQEEAIEILKIMLPKELLKPQGKIEFVQTSHSSPMGAVYDFVSPEEKDGRQAQTGDKVILGASTKGGDSNRWNSLIKKADTYVRPGVEVMNVPVDVTSHDPSFVELIKSSKAKEILAELPTVVKAQKKGLEPDLSAISAGDARHIMGFLGTDKKDIAIQLLNAFFGNNTAAILASLNLPDGNVSIEETSVAAGSIGGTAGSFPLGSTSVKRKPAKTKKKTKKNENIDITLVEEVLELFIERGILS